MNYAFETSAIGQRWPFAKYGNCIIESWYQKIVELPVLQCCFIPAVIVVS